MFLLTSWRLCFHIKSIRILSIFRRYSLGGVGRACRTCVTLEISKLLATQTRPMGVILLYIQFWTNFFIDSFFFNVSNGNM